MSKKKIEGNHNLKLVVVGHKGNRADQANEKTHLLNTFINAVEPLPEGQYRPDILDHTLTTTHNNRSVALQLHNTAGQENYNHLRAAIYRDANVFVAVMDPTDTESINELINVYLPELEENNPHTPIVIFSNNEHVRNPEVRQALAGQNTTPEANLAWTANIAQQRGYQFFAYDATKPETVKAAFDHAVATTLNPPEKIATPKPAKAKAKAKALIHTLRRASRAFKPEEVEMAISNPNGFRQVNGHGLEQQRTIPEANAPVEPISTDELIHTLVTNPNKHERKAAFARFLATDTVQNPPGLGLGAPQHALSWRMGVAASENEMERVTVMVEQFVKNRTQNQGFRRNAQAFNALVRKFPCLMGALSFRGDDSIESAMLPLLKQALPPSLRCRELDPELWTETLHHDVNYFFVARQKLAELVQNGLDLNSPEALESQDLRELENAMVIQYSAYAPFYSAKVWNRDIRPGLVNILGENLVDKKPEEAEPQKKKGLIEKVKTLRIGKKEQPEVQPVQRNVEKRLPAPTPIPSPVPAPTAAPARNEGRRPLPIPQVVPQVQPQGVVPTPPAPRKLVCFDADLTLFSNHMHAEISSVREGSYKEKVKLVCKEIRKTTNENESQFIKNFSALKETFQHLVANGTKIAITTRSEYPPVIQTLLNILAEQLHEPGIKTIPIIYGGIEADNICPNPRENWHRVTQNEAGNHLVMGKTPYIKKAMEKVGMPAFYPKESILLVDDDPQNILVAQRAGYRTAQVPVANGDTGYLEATKAFSDNNARRTLPNPNAPRTERNQNRPNSGFQPFMQ